MANGLGDRETSLLRNVPANLGRKRLGNSGALSGLDIETDLCWNIFTSLGCHRAANLPRNWIKMKGLC